MKMQVPEAPRFFGAKIGEISRFGEICGLDFSANRRSNDRAMAIAQLNRRSSLRDLLICLQAHQDKLYHLDLASGIS